MHMNISLRRAVDVCSVALLAMALLAGCRKQEKPSMKEGYKVFASNYPLGYFAQRICGNVEWVVFPEIDGDPAFWKPSIKDITSMQQANIVLVNGATYEKWLDKVTLSNERLVDTSASFHDQYIPIEHGSTHSHGPTGQHAHGGMAFTTWIDFSLALEHAKAVADALSHTMPESRQVFQKNYVSLKRDLMALDRDVKAIVASRQKQPLVASHPVYQYFSRRYDLNVKTVHWEHDDVPDEKQWKELKTILKSHPAKWMIWEGQPNQETMKQLKALGVKGLVFDPCGNVPDMGDFMTVMRQNIENLRRAFE